MNPTAQIPTEQPEENKIAGTLGAFLFALAGGLAYFALWQLGFIAAISGFLAVFCAMKGYKLFAKKESVYGVVTSVVVSVLVIVIAWYFSLRSMCTRLTRSGTQTAKSTLRSRSWKPC